MPTYTGGLGAKSPFGVQALERNRGLARQLVLAYPVFNDRRTDVLKDYGPFKQNATPVNGPTKSLTFLGEAFQLTRASSQYLQVGGNTRLNSLAPITISLWMKPVTWENSGGARGIVEKLATGGHGFYYLFRQISSPNLEFQIDYSTTVLKVQVSSAVGVDGLWHHYCVTWDGTSTAANVKIYEDGVALTHGLDQNGVGTINADSSTTNGNGYFIGSEGGTGNYLDSYVTAFGMWDRLLTGAERYSLRMNPRALYARDYGFIDALIASSVPFPQFVTATSGIHVGVNMGSPTVIGPPGNVIISTGIRVGVNMGTPTVTGGINTLQAYVGNVNVSKYLIPMGIAAPKFGGGSTGTGGASSGPVTITSNQIGRAQATFDLYVDDLSGYVPRATQTVILQEFGKKLFAGCIASASTEPLQPGLTKPIFHILAKDKSSILDQRVVIKTYPVGTDVQTMILDIVSNFLNGEGITTGGVSVLDTLDSQMVFNHDTVTQAFDRITALTGAQWWVDMNGDLNFVVLATSPVAPFSILSSSNNYRNLISTETTVSYANQFYAVSNLILTPGGTAGAITASVPNGQGAGYSVGNTFTVNGSGGTTAQGTVTAVISGQVTTYSLTNPGTGYLPGLATTTTTSGTGSGLTINITGVSTAASGASGAVTSETYTFVNHGGTAWQERAFQAGLAPGYVLLNLPIRSLQSVTINGSPVSVFPLSNGFQPGHAYYWFDGSSTAAVIFPQMFVPSIGDVIVVGYFPLFQNSTVSTGTPLTGTCGSGVIEGVIQAPNIKTQSDLDAIAAAYLAQYGSIPRIVGYETDLPGLAVGQQQTCDIAAVGLGSTTIYITAVTATRASDGQFDLGGGSTFRYAISASTQQNPGNWLTWFERFIERTKYPLPLDRFETGSFVLAPGGSLAGGVVITNQYKVQNTGLVFLADAIATVAPVGQDLLLDFKVNGTSVFGTAPLVIPAGSTSLVTTGTFGRPGLYVYAGDLITMVVTYRTLTLSPSAAGSVTANLRWSY